jgi:hypothetical protein
MENVEEILAKVAERLSPGGPQQDLGSGTNPESAPQPRNTPKAQKSRKQTEAQKDFKVICFFGR